MKKIKTESAIEVRGVFKTFKIPLDSGRNIKQRIVHLFKKNKGYRYFSPLNGISFTINKGEFFGIVGRNGSGKSTLLKTMAGIYSADKGSIKVNGKLVPFIELGVGFNGELTGRENVYLNGALLGFSRDEIANMYDEIVEFAELHDFMEEQLKNYSSGMQVRLAFSIAIQAKGDILLLDEVLAVGDSAFQQKCYDYFGKLKRSGRTVVLVTHNMTAVEQYCSKALLLENGKVLAMGTNIQIAEKYREIFIPDAAKINATNNLKKTHSAQRGIKIDSIDIVQENNSTTVVRAFKPFSIRISFKSEENVGPSACGINVVNSRNILVLATGVGAQHDTKELSIKKGLNGIEFIIKQNVFTEDNYSINLALARGDKNSSQELIYQETEVVNFSIRGVVNRPHSLVHPEVDVIVRKG